MWRLEVCWKLGKLLANNDFLSEGFKNWKKAKQKSSNHESSQCHEEAHLNLKGWKTRHTDTARQPSQEENPRTLNDAITVRLVPGKGKNWLFEETMKQKAVYSHLLKSNVKQVFQLHSWLADGKCTCLAIVKWDLESHCQKASQRHSCWNQWNQMVYANWLWNKGCQQQAATGCVSQLPPWYSRGSTQLWYFIFTKVELIT